MINTRSGAEVAWSVPEHRWARRHNHERAAGDDWYGVADGSFEVGPLEYLDPRRRQQLFRRIEPEVSQVGFRFEQEDWSFIAGPISSVWAVRRGRS